LPKRHRRMLFSDLRQPSLACAIQSFFPQEPGTDRFGAGVLTCPAPPQRTRTAHMPSG
jgi:hypothetical protein